MPTFTEPASRLTGEIMLVAPVGLKVTAIVLGVALTGFSVFASIASLPQEAAVTGWMTSSSGLIRLTAPRGGTLASVLVAEGAAVRPRQPIAVLSLAPRTLDGDSYHAVATSLDQQRLASGDLARVELASLAAEQDRLRRRRDTLQQDLGETQRRIDLQSQRLEIARNNAARAEELNKQGYLTLGDLSARKTAALELEQGLSSLKSAKLAIGRDLDETATRIETLGLDERGKRAQAAIDLAGISERAAASVAQSQEVVATDVPGTVEVLSSKTGQVLQRGRRAS